MKNFTPLPTANEAYGFWGTSVLNGYDAKLAWETTCHFLHEHFDLNAEQARDLLDFAFGRHLSDDLDQNIRFIENKPITAETITAHLQKRIVDKKWKWYFREAVREALKNN